MHAGGYIRDVCVDWKYAVLRIWILGVCIYRKALDYADFGWVTVIESARCIRYNMQYRFFISSVYRYNT